MTQIIYGERELILRAVEHAEVLVADDVGLTSSSCLETRWRQKSFSKKPLAIMNPPEPGKKLRPVEGYFILFDKTKIPKAWLDWASKNKVQTVPKFYPEPDQMKAYLTSKSPVKFSSEAAEWYTRVVGTSPIRMETELAKLLLLSKTSVDLTTLLTCIAGEETLKAERVLATLGTKEAIRLAKSVPPEKSIGLLAYLQKAIEHRHNEWGLYLKIVWLGANKKQYDYWTGVQIFAHLCYKSKTHNKVDLALDVYRLGKIGDYIE
jgi:hypothetical protein